MKVKFIESITVLNGGYEAGAVHEVNDKLARQWIKNGWCVKAAKNDNADHEQDGQIVQAPALVEKPEEEPESE